MTEETAALLDDAVKRLQRAVAQRDCPAIAVVSGTRKLVLSDYDYLREPAAASAFESKAAEAARSVDAERWVIAVPQVWVFDDAGVLARRVSNHPLRPGEEEVLAWAACDPSGIDYGCVRFDRSPGGEPVWREPEIVTAASRATAHMPGMTLLHTLTREDSAPTENRE